jgi:hypothetical protein
LSLESGNVGALDVSATGAEPSASQIGQTPVVLPGSKSPAKVQ